MASLRGRRQLRDVVREQGAAVGQFEAPVFELVSAGKGAAFVAERSWPNSADSMRVSGSAPRR